MACCLFPSISWTVPRFLSVLPSPFLSISRLMFRACSRYCKDCPYCPNFLYTLPRLFIDPAQIIECRAFSDAISQSSKDTQCLFIVLLSLFILSKSNKDPAQVIKCRTFSRMVFLLLVNAQRLLKISTRFLPVPDFSKDPAHIIE